jgi:signal transduction histidine kinase
MLAVLLLAAVVVRGAWSAARLERRLSRAQNLAAMGRLTATLAHEIKNPLAIIRGSALRLGRLEPEARRMADFVVEETDRLSRTVARYLEFARGSDAGGAAETEDAAVALEAMPQGGHLAVSLAERAGRIEVGIADDGVGIPAGTLKRLGSPCFTTRATGSGLGLFLSRRPAESAGGELRIQSEVGRGTTSTVRFPKAETTRDARRENAR